jgi:uncharacterized protein YuzE
MKKFLTPLFPLLALLCLDATLKAEPPKMPSDTHATCIKQLNDALAKNDVSGVKRQAANLKSYGLQGEGEAIIQKYIADNKSMKAQIKAEHQALYDARRDASQKSIKECYRLITNMEKKFMNDMISNASGAVIGGGVIADIKNAINDVKGHYGDAQVLKGNANAIKAQDVLVASLTKLLTSLDKAQESTWTCGKNLETLSDAFTKAADATTTAQVIKDKPKKEDKKVVTKTPPPKVVTKTPPPKTGAPKTASKSTDPDAGKTTFKGYVSDKNGKIGLTETKDKNGNVTKVTYTTYDKNGKVIGVKTYGANGKLTSDTSAATAKAAKDTSQNVIKNTVRRTPPIPTCPGGGACRP